MTENDQNTKVKLKKRYMKKHRRIWKLTLRREMAHEAPRPPVRPTTTRVSYHNTAGIKIVQPYYDIILGTILPAKYSLGVLP